MPHPPHQSSFECPNKIRWAVQIIRNPHAIFFGLLLLRPTYAQISPSAPYFRTPQPMSYPQCERPSFTPIQNDRHSYNSVYSGPNGSFTKQMNFNCTPKVAPNRLLQRWRCSGGARFNTHQRNRSFWMTGFTDFLSTSIIVLTQYLKVGHDHFPSHPINKWLRGPTSFQLKWFRAHHPQRQSGQNVNLTIHLYRLPWLRKM